MFRILELSDIMSYLDLWVSGHGTDGYVSEDFCPPASHKSNLNHGIQQVRREIEEFARTLLIKCLSGTILEIGLGTYGGTHILFREIFDRVITIEFNHLRADRFKANEQLDSRSIIIVGRSENPETLKKVRECVESVDVLFIDGCHNYKNVASDWAMYSGLVREGGLIAFHDSLYSTVPDWEVAEFLVDLSRGVIDGKLHSFNNIIYSSHIGISYTEL